MTGICETCTAGQDACLETPVAVVHDLGPEVFQTPRLLVSATGTLLTSATPCCTQASHITAQLLLQTEAQHPTLSVRKPCNPQTHPFPAAGAFAASGTCPTTTASQDHCRHCRPRLLCAECDAPASRSIPHGGVDSTTVYWSTHDAQASLFPSVPWSASSSHLAAKGNVCLRCKLPHAEAMVGRPPLLTLLLRSGLL